MSVAAIVLAAGASSRMGEPKQLLRNEAGETLVHRAARAAFDAGIENVVIVVGAVGDDVIAAVKDLPVRVAHNAMWQSGLASSIQAGVREVMRDAEMQAVLIVTCDMPTVGAMHLRELGRLYEHGALRVASAYGGTVGIPAVIGRDEFAVLLELTGDRGAKPLLMRADTALLPLGDDAFDLDTPEDVVAWRARFAR